MRSSLSVVSLAFLGVLAACSGSSDPDVGSSSDSIIHAHPEPAYPEGGSDAAAGDDDASAPAGDDHHRGHGDDDDDGDRGPDANDGRHRGHDGDHRDCQASAKASCHDGAYNDDRCACIAPPPPVTPDPPPVTPDPPPVTPDPPPVTPDPPCGLDVACAPGTRLVGCQCVPAEPQPCELFAACRTGTHQDGCQCVPDDPPPAPVDACTTAADCTGILPHLCVLCAVGMTGGCAHYACEQGACVVRTCTPAPIQASTP
jgi:hypothetical protein